MNKRNNKIDNNNNIIKGANEINEKQTFWAPLKQW
jgi:hypothetical protein